MDPTINTINVQQDPPAQNTESVQITDNAITPRISAEDFVRAIDSKKLEISKYEETLRLSSRQETNRRYWVGDQIDASALRDDEEKWVENAIFRNMETFIPIATSRTPELSVTPAYKNQKTRAYATDVKRVEMAEWGSYQKMQKLMGRGIRNHQITLLGVFKKGYDPETGRCWTEEIVSTDLKISKKGDFVLQYIKDKTLGFLFKMFPDKKNELMERYGIYAEEALTKQILDSPVEYIEAWHDDWVGWKLGDLTLGVKPNPHFDYTGTEMSIGSDPTTGIPLTKKVFFNHFKKPKKPYLYLTYFNRGVHIHDDTSLIEQGIGPQNWINTRKRQIGLNANSTNGHWVSSGDYISQEEFEKIEGTIDEKIWLENGRPEDGLMKITGQPLPDYIYTDLLDSRGALDNLMGMHSTTRGEISGSNTATQDVLAKDQDYGRVDGYVRDGIENFAQEWYEYDYHMHLVYKTDEDAIAIPEEDDFEADNVLFSRKQVPLILKNNGELVPVPLLLTVKQGTTLPQDEVAEYQKAQNMKDILRPRDYFKLVGMPNPRELEKNLLKYQVDPMLDYMEDPDMQKLMAAQQQKAMAEQEAAAAAEEQKFQRELQVKQMDQKAEKEESGEEEEDGEKGEDETNESNEGEKRPANDITDQGVGNALRAMVENGEIPMGATA